MTSEGHFLTDLSSYLLRKDAIPSTQFIFSSPVRFRTFILFQNLKIFQPKILEWALALLAPSPWYGVARP